VKGIGSFVFKEPRIWIIEETWVDTCVQQRSRITCHYLGTLSIIIIPKALEQCSQSESDSQGVFGRL